MSDATRTFTMIGDLDAAACVDDACVRPAQRELGSVMSATVAENEEMSASESTNAL